MLCYIQTKKNARSNHTYVCVISLLHMIITLGQKSEDTRRLDSR